MTARMIVNVRNSNNAYLSFGIEVLTRLKKSAFKFVTTTLTVYPATALIARLLMIPNGSKFARIVH
jgi:hypothetical protein